MVRTQSHSAGRNHPRDGGGDGVVPLRKRRGPELSSLGTALFDQIALDSADLASPITPSYRSESQTAPGIVHSEFLVCRGGLCVPTDAALRTEEQLGDHYVLGHSTWQRCDSAEHAEELLAARIDNLDPHELASVAIALADLDDD